MKRLLASLMLVALLFSVVVPLAYAEEPAVDLTAKLETLWNTLVSFVLAALLWAFTGFFKVEDPKEDTFDPVQFGTTLIVGVVTGICAFVIYETTGTSLVPEQIWQYLVAAGFVAFVESWIKVVWRRVKPYFTPPT